MSDKTMAHDLNQSPVDILIVEDNLGDAELAVEAFKEARASSRLHTVQDGVQAMAFLRRQGPYDDAPRPHLVLLDLNLPRKDGREVLAEIKQDPGLKRIPVVILTTSTSEQDILKTYDLHANCYLAKPVDLDQFFQLIRKVEDYWFTIVKLPPA